MAHESETGFFQERWSRQARSRKRRFGGFTLAGPFHRNLYLFIFAAPPGQTGCRRFEVNPETLPLNCREGGDHSRFARHMASMVGQTTRHRVARRFERTEPSCVSAPSRILGRGMMTRRIGLARLAKNDQDAGPIGRSVLRKVNTRDLAVLAWLSLG